MPGPRRRSALISRLADRAAGSQLADRQAGSRLSGPADRAAGSRSADRQTGEPQAVLIDELRAIMLDGGVPPGSAIPVDAVAAAFGVSRIPVREALMTLIGEGLVDHRPHGGYRVAMMTAAEFSEIYLVREALETAALRVALEHATPADDALAREAHRALDTAVTAYDAKTYHRESRRFHLALIRPCHMRRLLHMLDTAWNMTEPLQPMTHLDSTSRALLHADHEIMLEAFCARDSPTLTAVFHEHHHRLQTSIHTLPQDTGLFET